MLLSSHYADRNSFTKIRISEGLMFHVVLTDTYAGGDELEPSKLFESKGKVLENQ